MIISAYGPDGVGKSTIVSAVELALRTEGVSAIAFSGTHIDEWPDQQWIQSFKERGIDESKISEPNHFIEKILRCYEMAGKLAMKHDVVLIDSDPLHKTLAHDILMAKRTGNDPREVYREKWTVLGGLLHSAGLRFPDKQLYVTLAADLATHGTVLMDRIRQRNAAPTYFDPRQVDDAQAIAESVSFLSSMAEIQMIPTLTIDTDMQYELGDICSWIRK